MTKFECFWRPVLEALGLECLPAPPLGLSLQYVLIIVIAIIIIIIFLIIKSHKKKHEAIKVWSVNEKERA